MPSALAAAPGAGAVEFERVRGKTVVTRSFAASPLKLLNPSSHDEACWLYSCSYGGGLVGGDRLSLDLRVGAAAKVLFSTQASTKVYRGERPSGQRLTAAVGPGATLVVAPDPLVCFAGSSYEAEQEFHLSADSSLVVVDWFTSGRAACGERWAFDRYASRIAIFRQRERLVVDSTLLDPAHGSLSGRFGRFNTLAVVFVFGPALAGDAARLVEDVRSASSESLSDFAAAASPIHEGTVLRFAARSVERLGAALRDHLKFLRPILGEEPWARKW
jgi:urease accessory protein